MIGGAGFIGTAACRELMRRGVETIAAGRTPRPYGTFTSYLAFGYKNGIPEDSAWVVDSRCLDNPYWVPELKPLDGRDPRVREYVLGQPVAGRLLDGLEAMIVPLLPEYSRRGRMELTIAFGCTGGRHRSVALAEEMARRLSQLDEVEVRVRARELGE